MEDDKTNEDPEPSSSKNIKQGGSSAEKIDKGEDKSEYSYEDDSMRSYSDDSDGEREPKPTDKTENKLMKGSHGDAKIDNKNKKKRPKKNSGRVEKKKRPALKRPSSRRRPKRRADRRDLRTISSATIFTRRSSFDSDLCHRCRQRYCRRRYSCCDTEKCWPIRDDHYYSLQEYCKIQPITIETCEHKLRKQDCQKCRHKVRSSSRYKWANRNYRVRKARVKKARIKKAPITKLMVSEAIQMGSRSNMLSPLHIASNCRPVENINLPCIGHSEITPEMIFDALRKLTMWRQEVPTTSILDYISRNNPVNTDKEALLDELLCKLTICVMMGIVSQATNGETWSLSCKLENRKLTKNHVTLFWKLHADTLRPVKKKVTETEEKPTSKDQACGTKNAEEKTLTLFEEDIL